MQFTVRFATLAFTVLASIASVVNAKPVGIATAVEEGKPSLMSHEEMLHWLSTTDAELTFVGERINPLSALNAQTTIVTYCTQRILDVCGGVCTVYNGGNTCLRAPGTVCMAATKNVVYCTGDSCTGSCNQLTSCGSPMDDGFCFVPGTLTIFTPADRPKPQ